MAKKPDCVLCRKTYGLHNETPPCHKCLPALWPENEIPAAIYARVKGQHIMGMGGPVDIRHEVVFAWIDRYRVSEVDREWCFDLVNRAYHNWLAGWHDKQESKK